MEVERDLKAVPNKSLNVSVKLVHGMHNWVKKLKSNAQK